MNIALAHLSDVAHLNQIFDQVSVTITLSSNYPDRAKQLADIGIRLEEKTLLEQQPIDFVLVVLKDSDINYSNMWQTQANIDTLHYLTDDFTKAFYCRPEVFFSISNLYKMNFDDYHFKNLDQDTPELLAEKILFVANRLGFNIDVQNS